MASADTSSRDDIASTKCHHMMKSTFSLLSSKGDSAMPDDLSLYDRLMAVKPEKLTRNKWAAGAGLNRNVFGNIRDRNAAEPETLSALLDHIGVSDAEFGASTHSVRSEVRATDINELRDPPRLYRSDKVPRTLQLIGTAYGSDFGDLDRDIELTEMHVGEVIEYLARPVELQNDPHAYALTIVGDSMLPRYRPGERVAVSPRSVVVNGDDVIVQLRGPDGDDGERIKIVLIKELVRRGPDYVELKQYRPDMVFRVDLKRVAAMHRVSSNLY